MSRAGGCNAAQLQARRVAFIRLAATQSDAAMAKYERHAALD